MRRRFSMRDLGLSILVPVAAKLAALADLAVLAARPAPDAGRLEVPRVHLRCGSALLTGAPEQLMSALTKLSAAGARGDLRGGSAISALCVVPSRRRWALLADHPPLEKRLARLAEMAREQGAPVGP